MKLRELTTPILSPTSLPSKELMVLLSTLIVSLQLFPVYEILITLLLVWSIFPTKNFDPELTQAEEFKQGTAALQACKEAGLKQIVYSTLDDGTGCVHWQSKAEGKIDRNYYKDTCL